MKKIISVIIVICLIMSLAITVHAASDYYLIGTINGTEEQYKFVDGASRITIAGATTINTMKIGSSTTYKLEEKFQGNELEFVPQAKLDSIETLSLPVGTYEFSIVSNNNDSIIVKYTEVEEEDLGGNDGETATAKGDYKDVTGTITPYDAADTVHSVDISWGDLVFNYNEGSQGVWDAEKHEYTDVVVAAWSWETDGNNKITVTNHSNTGIDAKLEFAAAEGINVSGEFKDAAEKGKGRAITDAKLSLDSADAAAAATEKSAYFHITGGEIKEAGTIGKITVTITDQTA